MPLSFRFFPAHARLPDHLGELVDALDADFADFRSKGRRPWTSNQALEKMRPALSSVGYDVERSGHKVARPSLYGERGAPQKTYNFDAVNVGTATLVEIEAGGAIDAHRVEKDLLQAAIIPDVHYLVVGVQTHYHPDRLKFPRNDYATVVTFLESVYAAPTFLPLKGVLVLGY